MSLRDDMTKHRIFVQRLSGSEKKNIKGYLNKLKEKATFEIAAGTSGDTLKKELRDTMAPLVEDSFNNLVDIASYESEFFAKVVKKNMGLDLKILDDQDLRSKLADATIPLNKVKVIGGETVVNESARNKSIETAYMQFANRKADEIYQTITDGITNNLNKMDILNMVNEKINGLQSTQANTLAQSMVNYVTNFTKLETTNLNSDQISFVQWVRDLEADSCDYCESEDGNVYAIEDAPETDVHWGCKCELIPIDNIEQ